MATEQPGDNAEKMVPLSVVFVTIGGIILMTVAAIWLLAPATIPWAIYNLKAAVLPTEQVMALPTPASVARVPDFLLKRAEQLSGQPLPTLLPQGEAERTALVPMSEAAVVDPDAGLPTRIVIPSIELDAPVDAIGLQPVSDGEDIFYQWAVPDEFLAGWHNSSALLGKPGNSVFNGHHNVHGEVFRYLVDLEVGDSIILYDAHTSYAYEVTESVIFPEKGESMEARLENAKWIEPTVDERITLVTCWPYETNSHRLVVVAKPITNVR